MGDQRRIPSAKVGRVRGDSNSAVRRIIKRVEKHPAWFALTAMAAVASIVGLAIPFVTHPSSPATPWSGPILIEGIGVVHRGPVWEDEHLDADEIVVSIRGTTVPLKIEAGSQLVAFWHLASGYETNWHVGKRRVGGNYELATLDAKLAQQGTWDFVVGGIEADKTYNGTVSIALSIIRPNEITESRERWLADENGWGFKEIPTEGQIAAAPPQSVSVSRVR